MFGEVSVPLVIVIVGLCGWYAFEKLVLEGGEE